MLNRWLDEFIGCGMLRLTTVLCGGIFLVLLIAGQDTGQLRQGLMTPPPVTKSPAAFKTATAPQVRAPVVDITEAVFVPAQPVRVVPETPAIIEALATLTDDAKIEPESRLAVVNARSVNVRSGPSTSDTVIGRLPSGEQVLIVVEENPVEGWSLVRIEGDGIEGYVATRLLQPVSP